MKGGVSGAEMLMIGLAGLLALGVALTGLGMLVNRVACGDWGTLDSPLALIQFGMTGEMAAFGDVDGCAAPASWFFGTLIGLLMLVVVLVVVIVVAWSRYKESDRYFIKDLRRREGIAKPAEIRSVGVKKPKSRVKTVRPTQKKAKLHNAALMLGRSEGIPLWVSLEESIVLIGPPRSGKGLHLLIDAILDAPGPVITTSSRADNYAATSELRAKKGPIALFDPQGLTGMPTTLKWSPITGCEDAQVARQRASSLISASGLGSSGSNAEWQAPAVMIMECLLHAAALDGRTVDDLMRWGNDPAAAIDAVEILMQNPQAAGGWGLALRGVINGDPKLLQNKWFGVSGCVGGLSVPSVREVLKPTSVEETFDIERFIRESGTLYIVGTKTGGGAAGPFLIAMMDAITEHARQMAAKMPGNRLDPPMSLVLDEIANIAGAWPGLTQLMADGGGVGISPFAVFQSMAQARDAWGAEAATALFDAATVKIQLGGASNTDDLKVFSELAGEREITQRSKSHQRDGTSVSEQRQKVGVLPISDLRRVPFGWGILLTRTSRPIFMHMTRWAQRKDSDEIKAALKTYNASLLSALTDGEDVVPESVLVASEAASAQARAQSTTLGQGPTQQEGETAQQALERLIDQQNQAAEAAAEGPQRVDATAQPTAQATEPEPADRGSTESRFTESGSGPGSGERMGGTQRPDTAGDSPAGEVGPDDLPPVR
ncbi:type IV secretory system conjugative DNA transfer family protein [Nesterenkonia sp. K-15-9-6]|uniref:type IV secretory system conjugative DNA transfer family protein n=1 Tax=Nesterenkonia sp. K-15-9-6 TaxID=3093918 RepID=UPI004044907B